MKNVQPPLVDQLALKEPTYDAERLRNDFGYRFDMVDQFKAYMESLEDTNERLGYFLKMTKAMGFELNLRQAYPIDEHPIGNYDGTHYTDEYGEKMQHRKSWYPYYLNKEQEQGIVIKAYFQEYVKSFAGMPHDIEIKPLSKLIADFQSRPITAECIQDQLNQNLQQIKENQSSIMTYLGGKRAEAFLTTPAEKNRKREEGNDFESQLDKIRKQYKNIIAATERELRGTESISWYLYSDTNRINLLLAVWSRVEYKLFLEEQISKPLPTADLHHEQSRENIPNNPRSKGYNKTDRDDAIKYFSDLIQNAIYTEVERKRDPIKDNIIRTAYKKLKEQKNGKGETKYVDSTLRFWLPKVKKEKLYDEIRQRFSS